MFLYDKTLSKEIVLTVLYIQNNIIPQANMTIKVIS